MSRAHKLFACQTSEQDLLPLSFNRIPVELPATINALTKPAAHSQCQTNFRPKSNLYGHSHRDQWQRHATTTTKTPLMSAHRVPQQSVEGIFCGSPTITYCSHHSNKLTVYYQFFLHSPCECVCPCRQFITVHYAANGKHRLAEHTNVVARIVAWENLVCAPTLGRASCTCHSLNRTELPTKMYGLRWIRG